MPSAPEPAEDDPALLAAVQRARKLLHRRALAGAAASTIPVPGVGWAADAALMSRLITGINAEFGLTPEQLSALPAAQRDKVEGAAEAVGSVVIGKFITGELVRKVALAVGKRLAIKQAAKYVPLGGQAMSALIGYNALRAVGEAHIRDCVQVCRQANLAPPATPLALPRPRRGSARG